LTSFTELMNSNKDVKNFIQSLPPRKHKILLPLLIR